MMEVPVKPQARTVRSSCGLKLFSRIHSGVETTSWSRNKQESIFKPPPDQHQPSPSSTSESSSHVARSVTFFIVPLLLYVATYSSRHLSLPISRRIQRLINQLA